MRAFTTEEDHATDAGGRKKRISITVRITLWYMLFLFIISVTLGTLMLHIQYERIKAGTENKLIKVAEEVKTVIKNDGADFRLDHSIRYYYKETYISVYDRNQELIVGRRPRGIEKFTEMRPGKVHEIRDVKGDTWLCYDDEAVIDGRQMYIRGMTKSVYDYAKIVPRFSLFYLLLPLALILAGIGGYLITKGAFAPVRRIIETTNEITKDADLSRRIPLGDVHDEIYELGKSINGMFERIEESMERQKHFTSDVSHELRNPIAIIQAQSEYAIEEPGYASEAVKTINRVSHRLSRMIKNLLIISRGESGRMNPEIEKFNFHEILCDIVYVYRQKTDEKNITIEVDADEDISMQTDEDMLTHIIVNLLDNAIKYGREKDGKIIVRAHLDNETDELVCTVSDDGEGIADDIRDRVWERFYRADTSRSSETSTGLGLSIVRTMCKILGGSVRLSDKEHSELGGASFEIRIPRVAPKVQ